jgi:hypothetical protein
MTITKRTAWIMAICLIIAGSIPATLVTIALYPQISTNTESIASAEELAANTAADNQRQQESLLAGCKTNNQLRQAVANVYRNDIDGLKKANGDLFPDIPPAKFARLIKKNIEKARESVKELHPVGCEKRYVVE